MPTLTSDKPYWLAVHKILGTSMNSSFGPLLHYYGSLSEFWLARDTVPVSGLKNEARQRLIEGRKSMDADGLWQSCQQLGIGIVTCKDEEFSKELLQIAAYPCILYYHGNLNLLNHVSVAIVGSRMTSAYGLLHSSFFAEYLSAHGICVVSGMAEGIDSAAHRGALKAGGNTIAVLGTGIDVCYPRSNQSLYERLCREALVVSEFPPGSPPNKWQFPQRNQVISGLSRLVLLIEAKARSGALITCDHALEQGREVCALPGPVTNPGSIGPLRLIQQGAKLVITPQDVMLELQEIKDDSAVFHRQNSLFDASQDTAAGTLEQEEKKIMSRLSYEPVHIDQLLEQTGMAFGSLFISLAKLKKRQIIDELPGSYYLRI